MASFFVGKSERQNIWIERGYAIFAVEGPTGLKIKVLPKIVNKNKSSVTTILKTWCALWSECS
jgi:hypothetical protein